MRLRTRSRFFLAFALVLTGCAVLVAMVGLERFRSDLDRVHRTNAMVEDIFLLESLAGSYSVHPGERSTQQWRQVSRQLRARLHSPPNGPERVEELARIADNLDSVEALFDELVDLDRATTGSLDPAQQRLRNVLVSQISITIQGMLADVHRWYSVVYDRMIAGAERFVWSCLALFFLVTGLLAGAVWMTERSVLRPLADVGAGMDRVAEGHLEHRIDLKRRDELGSVARSFDRMTERLQQQIEERERTERALKERVKELRTLYRTSRDLSHTDEPLEERLQSMVEALPAGWLHPEVTEARIRIGDDLYATEVFRESPWTLAEDIEVRSEVVGRLEVVLTEERPEEDIGPFLSEEQELIGWLGKAIAETIEHERLEQEFLQAQKLEAVGQLSGGVAHDFNNILTVIGAHADFLLMDLTDPGAKRELKVIREATDQAAELTRRLLAFSRDQVLRPKRVGPNEVVESLRGLVTRILGEDVGIETELAENLPAIRVDPAQLEQALLNLAVNSRDAMPEGGTLTLTSAEVEVGGVQRGAVPSELAPGRYVCLSVSDTGVGMDDATRQRIFEPFFSTKGREKGTGLGLAMVYGIVRQSGGAIQVQSEIHHGSTFSLYLPAAEGPVEERTEDLAEAGTRRFHEGRLLVVEDEPGVRRVVRKVLERAGYEVVTQPNAESGLEVFEHEKGAFDLLLTDLVLPGLSGSVLADHVLRSESPPPIVVMSGYAEGSPGRHAGLPPEVFFLEKPFTPEKLLATIEEALNGAR